MKVALKLFLAATLGILCLFTFFAYSRAKGELRVFDVNLRQGHELIGSTLAQCVASTWVSGGRDNALKLIEQADEYRPRLRIGWLDADGTQICRQPMFTQHLTDVGGQISHAFRDDPRMPGHTYLVTAVPVKLDAKLIGAIEIAESLAARQEYISENVRRIAGRSLLNLTISGTIVLSLGIWMIGRPLRLLTIKAQRVGAGDLARPLTIKQHDEIGQLAKEFNVMCDRIAAANARAEAEMSVRLKAMEQLRHADRLITVGRLASGIAHELGTPLNVINGRVAMLLRGNVDAETTRHYLQEIENQSSGMAAIIRQLLDFARRREPKTMTVELNALARRIARLVEAMATKKDVRVNVIAGDAVMAEGDATQLEQVMSNLVVNAIYACSQGGKVDIACGSDTAHHAAGGVNTQRVFVSVSDDGHGMETAIEERIFEPFFTTKDVGQGTGLGLSVAHGIVQDHGGNIEVTSSPGQGSTFTVYLKRAHV